MWDPLELAGSIPNPCFYGGGKRIAVHTQPVLKNKTKPHSCCLSEQRKKTFSVVVVEAVEKCVILADGGESAFFQLICDKIPPGLFSQLDLTSTGIEVTRGLSLCPLSCSGMGHCLSSQESWPRPGELFRGKMRLIRNI